MSDQPDRFEILFTPGNGTSNPFFTRAEGMDIELIPNKPLALPLSMARTLLHPETGNKHCGPANPADVQRLWSLEERQAMKTRALGYWPHPDCYLGEEHDPAPKAEGEAEAKEPG